MSNYSFEEITQSAFEWLAGGYEAAAVKVRSISESLPQRRRRRCSLERAREFRWAVDTLAAAYGVDIRDCILNQKVKLSHKRVVILALHATRYPVETRHLGDIIRAGNTRLLRELFFSRPHRA